MARKSSSGAMRWLYPDIAELDRDQWSDVKPPRGGLIPELINLGCQKYSEAYQLTMHAHEQAYEFVYLEHGSVTWEINGVHYPTSAGQWFFTYPGELHKARFDHMEPSRIWWLIVKDPACGSSWLGLVQEERDFIHKRLLQLPRVFRGSNRVREQFERLKATLEQEGEGLKLFTRHQVLEILLGLLQPAPIKTIEPGLREQMVHLVNQLGQSPEKRYSIAEMAQSVNVSESHFFKIFHETFGQSPAAYLERIRIERACVLLQSSQAIIDVAHELGFKTSQHFTNVFRKVIGCSPSMWRRSVE
ncbi:AraC family transcriptional regulator [Paenibacillus sp. OV219]|uniref:helix-turn-helix transcriptional regulator n=1 Tax=Paenibacillus sp. OV219 TaxID=1884377 RepID=UPI0008AEC7D8|nr:AraC family transcriptional regulator [Paenibacillus sp. OV219]SEO89223.1 AraC-type DNA-binding protein [Paenibacillus sp. OV219]